MKKFFKLFAAFALVLAFASPVALAQDNAPAVNQADIDAINEAQTAVANFTDALSDPDITQEELNTRGATARGALQKVITRGFFSTALGQQYMEAGRKVQDAARAIKADVASVTSMFGETPSRQIDEAFIADYNNHLNDMDAAITGLNAAVDVGNENIKKKQSNENKSMLAPFGASLVVLAGLYAWASKAKNDKLKAARKTVAGTFIVVVAGLGITALSYVFSDKLGGKFVVAWGLVVVGAVYFVKALIEYNKVRKALRSA